jgi:DNA primase
MQTNEQKNALIKEFIPILINTTNALEFDSYVRKLSNVTGFEMESIKKVVKETRINPTKSRDEIVSRYNPENKLLRRLLFAEREMLYQMLNNKEAVDFYEKELSGFYDETFRTIANYIVDYASRHEEMNVSDLIATLEEESPDNKDKLIQTMTDLQFEKNHPNYCSKELLDGLMKNMEEEREKIFEEDRMKNSLQGKSPQEQARLLAEYNKRKLNKLKK